MRIMEVNQMKHYDVAIVGGGISGLMAAHRLLRECPDLNMRKKHVPALSANRVQ